MAETGLLFMELEHHKEPRDRLAAYLRRKFPLRDGYAAKRLSNAIDCTPRTAENILAGHWPNSRHWQRIVILFGRDALDAVFGPDIDATVSRLKQEEAQLEELLALKRARRIAAEGSVAGPAQHAETHAPPVASNVASFAQQRRREP